MTDLADISLLRPLWIVALPVIIGLGAVAVRRPSRLGDWNRRIDPHLMLAMQALGRVDRAGGQFARQMPFWAALAIALALTGPASEQGEGQSFRNLDGVVFVMDVSGSMTRDDSWAATLTMARAGLSALDSKPAALVVFAGDSYEASALTTDHRQLGQTIALLDETTVPDVGSRPALALQEAADILRRSDIMAGDVVLFSDGAGFGPETLVAAKEIAELDGRLLLVRSATTVSGEPVVGRAEFETLAATGNGAVFEVSETGELMRVLGDDIGKRLERQDFDLAIWTDYGRFLLLLALVPLAGLFRREVT